MAEGITVVLVHCESLYESLYDLVRLAMFAAVLLFKRSSAASLINIIVSTEVNFTYDLLSERTRGSVPSTAPSAWSSLSTK